MLKMRNNQFDEFQMAFCKINGMIIHLESKTSFIFLNAVIQKFKRTTTS